MSQFTIYRSSDSSAPTLSGTVGDLVNLLDKCLVVGYGSKSAAGWSKPYTGTNKAVFRNGTGSNQMYFRVGDDAPGAGGAKEARISGYEAMTDVDTGTRPFPTAAQGVGGIAMQVARKSATADATTRTWIVVADARTMYCFILTGDTAGIYLAFGFGEFYSLIPSDGYRCFISGRIAENSSTISNDRLDNVSLAIASAESIYIPRGHNGTGGSVSAGRHGDNAKSGNALTLRGALPFANPSDGGMYLSPVWIHDPITTPVNGLRGRLRGFWQFLHPIASIIDGETVTGVGDLAGKTFLFIKESGNNGVYTIETSDTLEINT